MARSEQPERLCRVCVFLSSNCISTRERPKCLRAPRCPAPRQKPLEQLCRRVARPAALVVPNCLGLGAALSEAADRISQLGRNHRDQRHNRNCRYNYNLQKTSLAAAAALDDLRTEHEGA